MSNSINLFVQDTIVNLVYSCTLMISNDVNLTSGEKFCFDSPISYSVDKLDLNLKHFVGCIFSCICTRQYSVLCQAHLAPNEKPLPTNREE